MNSEQVVELVENTAASVHGIMNDARYAHDERLESVMREALVALALLGNAVVQAEEKLHLEADQSER